MNRTVSDYIAEVKIEHAKELIDSGQFLIYEIADQLGFDLRHLQALTTHLTAWLIV